MIRVVLADDQELLRRGLRGLLELTPEIEVVGEAGDGAAALALARELAPDVLVLDVRMPGLDGIGVLEALRGGGGGRAAAPPVVLLTTFDDPEARARATAAGARAFLLKDVSLEVLVDAIARVAAGASLLGPVRSASARQTARAGARDLGAAPHEPLTPREAEVLALMARGFSNREIAHELGTREGTVKNHASSVLAKLGVRDRTQAVLKAIALGWV